MLLAAAQALRMMQAGPGASSTDSAPAAVLGSVCPLPTTPVTVLVKTSSHAQ